MRTKTLAGGLAVAGALAIPASTGAAVSELAQLDAATKGSCPTKPCFAMSHTTGYQAKVGDTRAPTAAPANGRIVAFTVGLGAPGKTQTSFFAKQLGAKPELQLTIINAPKKLRARAVAQSEPFDPSPYFGTTAQFALKTSLPVKKGQIVALTTTTWAPVIQVGQPNTSSWRASRGKGTCDDNVTDTQQVAANELARYYCLYKGVRLAYSATFIPDPTPAPGKSVPTTTGASGTSGKKRSLRLG